MHRFIDGEDRLQQTLLPHSLEDYVGAENPVRVIEAFIDELDLAALGFAGMMPAATGRPAYHPSTLLKIYLYGYLNRVQSSRRLEREAQRNIELMWLTGRLAPDFKTIADFRKDNGAAIQSVCRQFVELCRRLKLFTGAVVAIDGSQFQAGYDRHQLAPMAFKAQHATGCEQVTALADRGYFSGDQVLSCEGTGVAPIVPKTLTSSGAKRGLFTRQDFIYDAEHDHYTCPAGAKLTKAKRRADHTEDFDRYR